MNNAKMWLVIKPSIGIPVFIAGVAATSLTVHAYVLGSTSWMEDFLNGKPLGSGDSVASLSLDDKLVEPASHTLVGSQEIFVKGDDGKLVKAVLKEPTTVALLE